MPTEEFDPEVMKAMEEDRKEFLGEQKPAEPDPLAEFESVAPKSKKPAKDYGRTVPVGPKSTVFRAEDIGQLVINDDSLETWIARLAVVFNDFQQRQLKAGIVDAGSYISYRCDWCGEIVKGLPGHIRNNLPESHPDKIVRCPNNGKHKEGMHLAPMAIVE